MRAMWPAASNADKSAKCAVVGASMRHSPCLLKHTTTSGWLRLGGHGFLGPVIAQGDEPEARIVDREQAQLGSEREDADERQPRLVVHGERDDEIERGGREHQPRPDIAAG